MAASDAKQQKPADKVEKPQAGAPAATSEPAPASEPATAPEREDAPDAVTTEGEGPARFSVEELLNHSRRLTGASRHVLFGALSTHDGSPLTAAEAREKVEAFRQKEVAPR